MVKWFKVSVRLSEQNPYDISLLCLWANESPSVSQGLNLFCSIPFAIFLYRSTSWINILCTLTSTRMQNSVLLWSKYRLWLERTVWPHFGIRIHITERRTCRICFCYHNFIASKTQTKRIPVDYSDFSLASQQLLFHRFVAQFDKARNPSLSENRRYTISFDRVSPTSTVATLAEIVEFIATFTTSIKYRRSIIWFSVQLILEDMNKHRRRWWRLFHQLRHVTGLQGFKIRSFKNKVSAGLDKLNIK